MGCPRVDWSSPVNSWMVLTLSSRGVHQARAVEGAYRSSNVSEAFHRLPLHGTQQGGRGKWRTRALGMDAGHRAGVERA